MAWILSHAEAVIFTAALSGLAVGFGMAWLPLGFIVPCGLVVAVMIAWRWRPAPRKGEDD